MRAHAFLARLAAVLVLALASTARAQSVACEQGWVPTFGVEPGVNGTVLAMTTFDDGNGPALYVGGLFPGSSTVAAPNVIRWDGARWSSVGGGTNGAVRALAVLDDGSGPALYAGGDFTSAGGVAANHVARWNGTSWSPLATGVDGGTVRALCAFDDGTGPALWAAGNFHFASGGFAYHVARWNGSAWSNGGQGLGNSKSGYDVRALAVVDVGSGPQLFAGGQIPSNVMRWNGTIWTAVGGGTSAEVNALTAFDDGSGAKLVAGGRFTSAGGAPAAHVATWNGTSWSALGSGVNQEVTTLATFDDGGGEALYAGGFFTTAGGSGAVHLARWNGSTWSTVGDWVGNAPSAMTVASGIPSGAPPSLVVAADRITRWDGTRWSVLGRGLDERVLALASFDDGNGEALYAGGQFEIAGGRVVHHVARWNGSSWSQLGNGIASPLQAFHVDALTTFDDGTGEALYAGGWFTQPGSGVANHVARWNGTSWSQLGIGTNDMVLALATFDDGGGEALYAGGVFTSAGGAPASYVARWDGTSWSPLGSGMDHHLVRAFATFDDGTGPALYAGGSFGSAGGVAGTSFLARWNGTSWSSVGGGLSGTPSDTGVAAMTVLDDGSGPALIVAGSFTSAGGVPASNVARWGGTSWTSLGSGTNSFVTALTLFEDGTGPVLVAAGDFTSAGGVPANRVAWWNGSTWFPLGSGVDQAAYALLQLDGAPGEPALYVGGLFASALESGDAFLAKWGCLNGRLGTPTCAGDGSLATPCPCGNAGATGHGCASSVNAAGALLEARGNTVLDDAVLLGSGMPATSSAIYLKGDAANAAGIPFGDGVRCTDGTLVRLRTKQNVGGASSFPDATDTLTLSARGGTAPGSGLTAIYQTYYRNAAASFCPPATFNATNGVAVVW